MGQNATIYIDRPASAVFEYVMEVPHDAEWRTGIVEAAYTSTPPRGVGTTGFARVGGKGENSVAAWTTTEYQPGVLARWKFVAGPLIGTGGYICEESGDGTRFTLEADVRPTTWLRLAGPLFGILVRRFHKADVRKLKSILEGAT